MTVSKPIIPSREYVQFRQRLVTGMAAAALLVAGIVSWKIYSSQIDRRYAARAQTQSFVHAIDAHVSHSIQLVDFSLRGIANAIKLLPPEKSASHDTIHQLLSSPNGAFINDFWLLFIDARGIGIASSNTLHVEGVSFADRDYFKAHTVPGASLFIGEPVIGKTSGKPGFVISRRVESPDGRFLGVIAAPMNAGRFASVFESARFNEEVSVTLIHQAGKIMARSPRFEQSFATDVSKSDLFHYSSKAPSGTYESTSMVDDKTRVYSYRALENLPLFVTVGISSHAWSKELGEDLIIGGAGISLMALLMILSARVALKSYRRLEEAQTALNHSQKLEAVGKLTGGVAHDFNNVLQIIGGNLQLMQRHIVGNRGAEKHRDSALSAVERGAKLSSQLLAFARRQPIQPRVVSLKQVVERMNPLLRQALGESIEIRLVCADGLWNTLVDPYQMENVLLNIALNARDAMQGSGRLTIALTNEALEGAEILPKLDIAPGEYVRLTISDTGSGMTAEVIERAFEPFFTTKPEGEGTGLGLSMAYGFIRQSGGQIRISSEPGHGTTLVIYLPRSHEAESGLPANPDRAAEHGHGTVLVVEDDIAVQATVTAMLAELGYNVLAAQDGESALTILGSGAAIDLLFTDVVMPGPVNGPALARQARKIIPGLPVLFTSGYPQNAMESGGRLEPGINLLGKPYRRDQLAARISQLLSNETTAAVTAQPEVLVVEDNDDLRQLTGEMLSILGYRARTVASAEEALEALAASSFSVLLADIGLPGMNGIELAEKLTRENNAIRIIIASGRDDKIESSERFNPVVLRKPYNMAQLQKALEQT
ncbi:MAG: histidine kinase [Herminiimonas sp.]|nr:histidine kinase [Herminiimonas sp.]